MDTFEMTLTVGQKDLDDLQHVNNVRFVQWIQDVSKLHWQTVVPEEIRSTLAWVVMTHSIAYKSPAMLGDVIRLRTHIAKSKGAISTRIVEMYNDKTNILLLRSSTEWCLLSTETGKPMRISENIKSLFGK